MSFTVDISAVLQSAFNFFGSFLPLIYLFVGASFALFVIGGVLKLTKGQG